MATSRSGGKETQTRKLRIQFSATGEKRVIKAFERVDEGAQRSTEGLEGFRGSLLSIDAAMGIASTSLGALQTAFDALKAPVGLAVEWEKQFALIKTLNSNIGDDLEKQLLDLAGRVPQTAGDIAQSAYSAISAGIDPTEVVGFLEAASKAATAGSSTMAEATTALTKTLAGFKQEGLEASRAMDILFATVKRGDTNFTDLSASVGMVAGAAGTAGVSAEEMGAAIATLSKSAPNTSIAVTQLNALLKALQTETGASAANIRKLTGATGAANLKAKGLAQVLREIKDAVGDDVTAINSLTNSMEAQAAFNTLLSGGMNEYLADLEEVTNSVGALNNAHKELADITQTAISGFEAMKESAMREIGQELLPDINAALKDFGAWWGDNGAQILATITRIYRGLKMVVDASATFNDMLMTYSGINFITEQVTDLSEAIGIIPSKVEEVVDKLKEAHKEAEAFTRARRSDMDAFIVSSEKAVDAAIKRGDVEKAQQEQARQAEALRVRHMQQEAETLKRFYRMEEHQAKIAKAIRDDEGAERVKTLKNQLELMKVRQDAALKDNDTILASMRAIQDMNVKAEILAEKAKKRAAAKPKASPAARAKRPPRPQTGFISEALEDLTREVERTARESVERRFAFEQDLQDRRFALMKDDEARAILEMTTRHARERELARAQGQDVLALRAVQEDEINAMMEAKAKERRDREAARMSEWAEEFRAGNAETVTAMEQIASAAEAIGISGDLAQKAMAYTRALVSLADAGSFAAESAAALGSFNYFSAFKFAAASAGKFAAATSYFKAAGKGGGSTQGAQATGGGGGVARAQSARASEGDLGRRSSSSSGKSQPITYQLNFNAPVFDTQGNVERAIATAARNQQRAPGGVSILTASEIKRAARA